jgi:hypothetical protein
MADIPKWRVQGDWFDTCNCGIPCPCTFAQPPTSGSCEGILAWHIRKGNYGGVRLDGMSVMALGTFKGNIWDGQTKASMAMFIDERADAQQREALQMRSADRRRQRASECRCTTPAVAKQDRVAWPPTGNRRQTRQTPSASNGIAPGGRASTSDSSGQDPTCEVRRVPVCRPPSSVVGVRFLPYTERSFRSMTTLSSTYCGSGGTGRRTSLRGWR